MKFIEYLAIRFWLFIFFLIGSTPLFVALVIIAEAVKEREQLHFINIIIAFVVLAWFGSMGWLVQQAANHITSEKKSFFRGVRASLADAQLRLAFLPLIGGLFVRPPHKDEDNDAVD